MDAHNKRILKVVTGRTLFWIVTVLLLLFFLNRLILLFLAHSVALLLSYSCSCSFNPGGSSPLPNMRVRLSAK